VKLIRTCGSGALVAGLIAASFVGTPSARAQKTPAAPALQTVNPILSQFEDGGTLPGGQKLVAGETVFFRFGAVGFKTSETGRVQLTSHAQAFDPEGVAIMPKDEVVIGTSLRDEDKDWKPALRFQFQVPAIARAGTYRIQYDVTDDQTKKTAAGEVKFEVTGPNVPKSETLMVRGLSFYRTPDDETPLRVAAYRAGDTVWVKFDVTGYKYGEQNAIDVVYDVTVTSDEGKAMFSQQDAAAERSQAFYPQPWVPASFSLTLQPNMAVGAYNVEITARDGVGKQSAKAVGIFRIQ
jgi:hypothetical protein